MCMHRDLHAILSITMNLMKSDFLPILGLGASSPSLSQLGWDIIMASRGLGLTIYFDVKTGITLEPAWYQIQGKNSRHHVVSSRLD